MPMLNAILPVLAGIALTAAAAEPPGIPDQRFHFDFQTDPLQDGWIQIGPGEFVEWDSVRGAVHFTWDSSQPNRAFAFPLGMTLTRTDDFTLSFTLDLESIQIGIDPAKPYTFQIAAGLVNRVNITDPNLHRAAGIDPENGPRNLVEWNYFPDSGFGATVAPTAASKDNHIAFSGNYPLEMPAGSRYRVEMTFSGAEQVLRTSMWRDGEPFGLGENNSLNLLLFEEPFSDFRVDAFAIASYSDAGQDPAFAGSVLAHAWIDDVEIVVKNRPELQITRSGAPSFPTAPGWRYFLERSTDLIAWRPAGEAVIGDGTVHQADPAPASTMAFYRVRAERIQE